MLRHSETSSTDTTSYRSSTTDSVTASPFTPEEIAAAIAEIENERRARFAPQSNAARISYILEQLNLDMAPTEVATKIERRRRTYMGIQQRRRLVFIGAATVASCLTVAGYFLRLGYTVLQPAQVAPVQTVVYAKKVAIAEDATAAARQAVAPAQDTSPAQAERQ